ncbi:hypothetical protein C8R44DRAFT_730768 [Mycena epipterygia]|nr:hypothetical protein C8R44DRAFT_730768 [Mycena epipterygia]
MSSSRTKGKRKATEMQAPSDPWSIFRIDAAHDIIAYFNSKAVADADPEDLESAFSVVMPSVVQYCSLFPDGGPEDIERFMLAVNVAARNARARLNDKAFSEHIKPLTATCPPRNKFQSNPLDETFTIPMPLWSDNEADPAPEEEEQPKKRRPLVVKNPAPKRQTRASAGSGDKLEPEPVVLATWKITPPRRVILEDRPAAKAARPTGRSLSKPPKPSATAATAAAKARNTTSAAHHPDPGDQDDTVTMLNDDDDLLPETAVALIPRSTVDAAILNPSYHRAIFICTTCAVHGTICIFTFWFRTCLACKAGGLACVFSKDCRSQMQIHERLQSFMITGSQVSSPFISLNSTHATLPRSDLKDHFEDPGSVEAIEALLTRLDITRDTAGHHYHELHPACHNQDRIVTLRPPFATATRTARRLQREADRAIGFVNNGGYAAPMASRVRSFQNEAVPQPLPFGQDVPVQRLAHLLRRRRTIACVRRRPHPRLVDLRLGTAL